MDAPVCDRQIDRTHHTVRPAVTTPPTDTDRIIEAQREQGHRTRVLLVWLLLGVPLIAGAIWGLIVLAAVHPSSANGDLAATTADTDFTVSYPSEPPETTTEVSPVIANFKVTDHTMCSTISDWFDEGTNGLVNPKDAPIYQGAFDLGENAGSEDDPVVVWLTSKPRFETNEDAYPDAARVEKNCMSNNGTLSGLPDETVLDALQSQ